MNVGIMLPQTVRNLGAPRQGCESQRCKSLVVVEIDGACGDEEELEDLEMMFMAAR
jgi:hypothetical protein